jgi:Beta-galactosidase
MREKTTFGRNVVALLLASATALVGAGRAAAEAVWVEGEDAVKTTFLKHNWYDDVNKDVLSNKNWLSNFGRNPVEASYKIKAADGGDYTFWIRCVTFQVAQDYKIDDGAWVACDLRTDVREELMLSAKPDIRFLAWCKQGKVKLTSGEHTVAFRLTSANQGHGGIDCFVFVNQPWVPSGVRKPGETKPAGQADWFEVSADDDSFSDKSITDMSGLLHKPAGKFGFVTRSGGDLVIDGKPVKFWGCGANVAADRPREWQEQCVRWLAKNGVNMVRQHPLEGHLGQLKTDPKTGERDFDKDRLDQWDWWFATLKKYGIYTTWSVFYAHGITPDDKYDLFDELPMINNDPNLRSSSGLVNVEPGLQKAEWDYVQKLLTHKNPYTGLRYIDDPALAVLETHNEDCIFFFAPLDSLVEGKQFPRHTARLKQRWGEWLKERYGSDDALKKAWGEGFRQGDSVDNLKMGIYHAWEMSADGPSLQGGAKPERQRMGDFIRFLADEQRGYYQRREKQLRALGYKAVTVTTAWRAGGPAADAANLWCYDAMDMIDRHNYFGGGVGGFGVAEGKVNNETHMGAPGGGILSSGLYQVEDKPFSMTEWTSSPPNQWKAEIAPLFAFYGMGLQGWDASYHFLSSRKHMGEGWPNMSAFVTDTPHYMGQFPALAFALAKGHVKEAPIAAARRLKPGQLFQGIDALQQDFTGGGYDAKAVKGGLATPTEVLAVGRVVCNFGDKVGPSEKVDWSGYWDKDKKVVKSMTGELTWDYGRRVVTLTAPKTQAVIGFAGGATQELPGATVEVKTPFVSLIFTPLDDLPLAESRHILITAMARDKQTGAEYNQDGTVLVKAGGPPLLMEPVQATITLKGDAPQEVNVVDIYGVPTAKKVPADGNRFTIDGRFQTYYYEVKR